MIKRNGLILLACALMCASCVREVRTASAGAHPAAVRTVMARQVQNAVDAGDGDLEARTLRKRLAADGNDLDARITLARLYSRRGLPELALEHYRLAAAQFPDAPIAVLDLAASLREMDEPGQALTAVRNYLARHPRSSWELLSLEGILEDDAGELAAAEAAHRAAVELAPGRGALHNNLGYNLLLQGKADEAAAEFRRAIEIDPRSTIAHNNLGTALALGSHSAEAVAEWQRSAGPAAAHNNLAAVLIEQGRYAEARAEIAQALALQRDYSPALVNLELVSGKDGQPATLPSPQQLARQQHVILWRRIASKLGTVVGGRKPASSAAGPAGELAEAGATESK